MIRLLPLAAFGLPLLAASVGHAQTTTATMCTETFAASLVRVDGPSGLARTEDELFRPLNIDHCNARDSVSLVVRYQDAPSTSWLDTWRGAASEDCSQESRRGGTGPLCTDLIATDLQNPAQTTEGVSLSLRDLTAVGTDPCSGTGGAFWFYMLGSSSTATTGPVTEYGCVEFEIDVTRPPTPSMKSTTLSGSSQVRLEWDAQDSRDIERYLIYVDTSGASCASANAATIAAGTSVKSVEQGSSETSLNLSDLGVPMDGERALLLVAQDKARNYSEPSQLVCVRKVPTQGFCDAYATQAGEACSTECSVAAPGAPLRHRWLPLGLLGVALVVVARRRRNQ